MFLVSGETLEVVQLYLPISLEGTDVTSSIFPEKAVPVDVISTPIVLSGAMPEDLLAALNRPFQLPSNNSHYKVTEANLIVINEITTHLEQDELGNYAFTLTIPEKLITKGIELSELGALLMNSVMKTVTRYYHDKEDPPQIKLRIEITENGEPEELMDVPLFLK